MSVPKGRIRFVLWRAWNRTRYYWPQAKSRRRAIWWLNEGAKTYGETYKPRKPWWIP